MFAVVVFEPHAHATGRSLASPISVSWIERKRDDART